jgi:hypothetical protein
MRRAPQSSGPPFTEEDRENALVRLKDAYADGHLTYEQMDERLHLLLSAQDHQGLGRALDRLPNAHLDAPVVIRARSGHIRREGAWRVPRRLTIDTEFGKAYLDLSRARIEYPVLDVELQLKFGSATVVLPPGAAVDLEGLVCDWKQPVYAAPRRAVPSGLLVRIGGHLGYGRLRVRHGR